MEKSRPDSKIELEFKKLHNELMELKLYDLAGRISTAFYDQSLEQFLRGAEMIK
jgi:hypothetical protein